MLARPVWHSVLADSAVQGGLGVAWSVVAIGLSPYLEQLFDLVTPIRLAELSNPNRPLLKKLAAVTPGTFQHTLFVATLAEAAMPQFALRGCSSELIPADLLQKRGVAHTSPGELGNSCIASLA